MLYLVDIALWVTSDIACLVYFAIVKVMAVGIAKIPRRSASARSGLFIITQFSSVRCQRSIESAVTGS